MSRTDITDDLVAVVRGAADAVPAHAGDLDAVRARGRARRRHRRGAVAAGLAAVALAAGAAVAVPTALAGQQQPPPVAGPPNGAVPPVAGPAAPAAPAQRLLVHGGGGDALIPDDEVVRREGAATGETTREAYERHRRNPDAVGVFGDLAEVLPDGSAVDIDLDLPQLDTVQEVVALPDGGFEVLGTVDLMPGVERPDGPCVAGLDMPLVVVEASGSVGTSRQVRVRCQALSLVGAETDTAYLLRDSRLVAHDLATGDERVLVDSPGLVRAGARVGVAGDAVVSVRPAQGDLENGCTALAAGATPEASSVPGPQVAVTVWDLTTGDTAAAGYELPGTSCLDYPGPVRVSPDGHHAAIAYLHHDRDGAEERFQLRVVVVDLDTGAVVADRTVLADTADLGTVFDYGPSRVGSSHGAIAGLAWSDEATLRVGWYEVPAAGVHWITDVIEVATVSVR